MFRLRNRTVFNCKTEFRAMFGRAISRVTVWVASRPWGCWYYREELLGASSGPDNRVGYDWVLAI